MGKLDLDNDQIERVKEKAKKIADFVQKDIIDGNSSVSVERAVLRLYGVDGVDKDGTPLPNLLVDLLKSKGVIKKGASKYFAAAMLKSDRDALTTSKLIADGHIPFGDLKGFDPETVEKKERELSSAAILKMDRSREIKETKFKNGNPPQTPYKYMIVATGDIYEDRTQAKAAALSGADIIAVIRSTAQSLLDYVPYGPTTEGFGGTFATQENFRIMREALDQAGTEKGSYVRLVNYASGLCMSEIAACAALEDLDMLLNDSMYGILFRDINKKRTFVDQHFSRLICSRAKIIINTGEDNYLTTSDAIENAYTVTASQLINEAMGKNSNLSDDLLGLGHAFEINPKVKNGFLLELAHAQLARQLFPNAPLKYMPPTKYKSNDIFFSQCMDTMFNLASVTTGQGIHLCGILTEAIHTPLMQDRFQAISNVNYIFDTARDLSGEIEFKKDGVIAKRAQEVLDQTEVFLDEVLETGLMDAISKGRFAGIKRDDSGGKGAEGVFQKDPDYSNPVLLKLEKEGK